MKHHYVEFSTYNEDSEKQEFIGRVHFTEKGGVSIDEAIHGSFARDEDDNISLDLGGVFSTPADGLDFLKNVSNLYSRLGLMSVTKVIEEELGGRGFDILSSTRDYEHDNRADVYVASTGSVIDAYNIVSIKDAPILHLINLDARNVEIEKVVVSNDFKHGLIKIIKNMRIDDVDGEIMGGESITPVQVGRGQVKANVRCVVWDGNGNGMEGLIDGEIINTTILKAGGNKASLGTIVLKQGESLTMKYDYDMNVKGQLWGGGDFECSVRFSYEG